ncbi:DUF5064 family protein [Streptomyces sp. SID8366]|uniref:DUF5064 family protein n=1 Tax=unclassified Streptomyces TaxID=2593676 RepID=UPI000DBA5DA5|nr:MULTISPECIES: DUF5064 family protein [unclassified Streptomyces]MYU06075.1 DUF5064 family protein [Streptomyces sp. SID8366]MYU68035.1 DUF5064 family protein [Streptomyces sp. SID69]RAJ64142.1 uncharacterized protein DUF5064 [Streptomyces sp. PsTaAH-130]
MAQWSPGCLEIQHEALNAQDISYDVTVNYEATTDPTEGRGVQFRMIGAVEGKPVDERFFLPADHVADFERPLTRKMQAYSSHTVSLSIVNVAKDHVLAHLRELVDAPASQGQ